MELYLGRFFYVFFTATRELLENVFFNGILNLRECTKFIELGKGNACFPIGIELNFNMTVGIQQEWELESGDSSPNHKSMCCC